jgi:hypothetical protein
MISVPRPGSERRAAAKEKRHVRTEIFSDFDQQFSKSFSIFQSRAKPSSAIAAFEEPPPRPPGAGMRFEMNFRAFFNVKFSRKILPL